MAFSQSPLATSHVPTKYKTKRSQKQITKVTWHHMAGVRTAKSCAQMHASGARVNCSANYYVGNDGDICSSVEESYRAWTSASSWNDDRAITIEISNDKAGGQWTISDKALKAAIALTIDICKRNGIKSVYYDGTKNAPLTCHFMFSATACPGPYLKSLFANGYIAQQINAGLKGANPGTVNPSSDSSKATTSKNPYTVPTTVLKKGSSGKTVRWVQWQLTMIFGYNLVVDGIFGNATQSALLDFQKRNNLTQTGTTTNQTITALKNENSVGANGVYKISLVKNNIDYSAVFDAQFYAERYNDLKTAFGYDTNKLFNHFLSNGMKEKRQAIATFDVIRYAAAYSDLRKAFGELKEKNAKKYYDHYCTNGKSEILAGKRKPFM